ncbi:MAG: NUDIX domain-containing protein [Phycisphaerales bacterium]|nr:MAG: NUDIX domain-containing protein [Phycisphaerales bacterium]
MNGEKPTFAAGIIERHDNRILIALRSDESEETRHWQFPCGPTKPGESPEEAMRRIARDDVRIEVEIIAGQPPIVEKVDGEEVEFRYFFCGVMKGEPTPGPYAELRWVMRGHLREYDFDRPSKPVVHWLLEQ